MTFRIDDAVIKKAETLAAGGMTMEQIAKSFGVHHATVYRKMNSNSEFCDAIKTGRAKGVAIVTNELMKSCKSGNVTAQIFFLTNRDPVNWRDRRHVHQHITPSKEIDPEIKRGMSPQQAAESYAETLKQGKGGNVIPLKKRRA